MSNMMTELLDSLQQLGLTCYEAKVLIALTQYGSRNVADIHALSGIPRASAYGVLNKLKDKGLIETQNTKPMRYKATAPDQIIGRLKVNYENAAETALEELEMIFDEPDNSVEEDGVWNINGAKNITDKIIHMLDLAKEEIILASSPYPTLDKAMESYSIMDNITQKIQEKIAEGLKVKITISEQQAMDGVLKGGMVFPGAEIRSYSMEYDNHPLKGGIVAIDNEELLFITVKDEVTPPIVSATWYNGKEQVSLFRHFIEIEWKVSRPISADGS